MRDRLPEGTVEHVGLAYEARAPFGDGGKVPDGAPAAEWLQRLENARIHPDYGRAFARWQQSFRRPGDRVWRMCLAGRLLVGHGNASGTDVGLTLHRTWGVPLVPGPALKGLVAHYLDAVYGPDDPGPDPWKRPEGEERERARWQGSLGDRGPGDLYRDLLGSPESKSDDEFRLRGLRAGPAAGRVRFFDAVYAPPEEGPWRPFVADVATVHQKPYYDVRGRDMWPNDHADPNPVSFLTVAPGTVLLFALSGPAEWTDLAQRLLTEALEQWGVGGKASSGYGRFVRTDDPPRPPAVPASAAEALGSTRPRHRRGDRIRVERVADPGGRDRARFRADDGVIGQFTGEPPPEVEIGGQIDAWVANVGQTYTLTLRQPDVRARVTRGGSACPPR